MGRPKNPRPRRDPAAAHRIAQRAAVPLALARRETGNRRPVLTPLLRAAETLLPDLAGVTYTLPGRPPMDARALFEWCDAEAWVLLRRRERVVLDRTDARGTATWALDADIEPHRLSLVAWHQRANALYPEEVKVSVSRSRAPHVSTDAVPPEFAMALLRILQSSGRHVRLDGGSLRGSTAALALFRTAFPDLAVTR